MAAVIAAFIKAQEQRFLSLQVLRGEFPVFMNASLQTVDVHTGATH